MLFHEKRGFNTIWLYYQMLEILKHYFSGDLLSTTLRLCQISDMLVWKKRQRSLPRKYVLFWFMVRQSSWHLSGDIRMSYYHIFGNKTKSRTVFRIDTNCVFKCDDDKIEKHRDILKGKGSFFNFVLLELIE